MSREAEFEKVGVDVTYDGDVVGQIGAGFKGEEDREGIERHSLALHPGVELEGLER